MHTPPDEDKSREEVRTSNPSPHYKRPVRPHYSSRIYDDDHPEVPRVRRASLRLDEARRPPTTPRPTAPIRRSARLQPPEQPASEQGNDEIRGETSGKIMVARPRRRRTVYEPPPTVYHRSRGPRKKPRTFYTQLQELSHNRAFLIAVAILLIGLIILPIGISLIVNSNHAASTQPTPGGGTNNANQTGTPSGVKAFPTDPHELVITPEDTDHPAPPVLATAAYLLDADSGATLYAQNPFMHLPVMSTTKLMTAVLAAEKGNPDQFVTITPAIAHDISQLSADSALFGVKEGESYTLRDLFYGMLLASGNDAAIAVADTIGGNLTNFVAMMNARANQLGLYDTHYMNPHGLLATGQYSSAHDLAVLARYALSLPIIHQVSGSTQYTLSSTGKHPVRPVLNGNQFLWWYPGTDGGKTGWDGGANYVQVVSSTRNHHHLIGVVIHTVDWWTDMRDLMNWGFDAFTWVSPRDIDTQHLIIYDNLWNYFASDKKENTIPTADQGRYYIYTGYSVTAPVLSYFDQGGGLKKFGYPTSITSITGDTTISQHFEHGTIQCDTTSKQCNAT